MTKTIEDLPEEVRREIELARAEGLEHCDYWFDQSGKCVQGWYNSSREHHAALDRQGMVQEGWPTEKDIDRALMARIPGGSNFRDWMLPTTSEKAVANVRDAVRLALLAASPRRKEGK